MHRRNSYKTNKQRQYLTYHLSGVRIPEVQLSPPPFPHPCPISAFIFSTAVH